MGPSFSHLQIDRHGSYFYLCIKAGTVFTLRRLEPCLSLRKIYLEPNRGEAEERGGRWALIKSLNENVWGSVRYFITTRPKNRTRRAQCRVRLLPSLMIWILSPSQILPVFETLVLSITAFMSDGQVGRLWPPPSVYEAVGFRPTATSVCH